MTAAAPDLPARAVALLSAAAFVSAATMRVADPLVPQVAHDFGVTPGSAGLVVTAFALAYGLCQLVWGPVGDRLGKYRTVAAMTLASALTVATGALAGSLGALALARLVSGATAAALIPLSMAFIGDHVPYERRQAVIARFLAGQITGLVAGQVFGGVFGDTVGWRGVFLLLAGLYLAVGLLLVRELRSGSLPPPVLAAPAGPGRLLTGYLGLLRRPWPRVVLATVFAEGAVFFGAFAFVGAYLHGGFGLGYAAVGGFLAAFGAGGLLFAAAVRPLVRRLGERGLATAGGALICAGFLGLAASPTRALLPAAIGLLGLGFYMLHNTLQTNATQMAPEARGLAVSAFAGGFFLGQALGAWLGGLLADRAGFGPLLAAAGPVVLVLALAFAGALRRRANAPGVGG
jgi:MFS transporter, YNFM family, putative membrane transport protein